MQMFTELCELHNFLHQGKWHARVQPTRLKIQIEKKSISGSTATWKHNCTTTVNTVTQIGSDHEM